MRAILFLLQEGVLWPVQYTDPEDRDHLKDLYVPLRCPEPEGLHCFIDDYMVRGTICTVQQTGIFPYPLKMYLVGLTAVL